MFVHHAFLALWVLSDGKQYNYLKVVEHPHVADVTIDEIRVKEYVFAIV